MKRIRRPAIVTGMALALLLAPALADSAPPLKPSLRVPALSSVSADAYFPLLLQWTQSFNVGNTALQVTYLDPVIIIAQIKSQYAGRAAQEAALRRQLGTFPRQLDAQVTYATPNRSDLHPGAWRAVLVGTDGAVVQGQPMVTAAPSFQTGATSANWTETVRYTFPNMRGQFLSPRTTALQARLSSPAGTATAAWSFVASASAPSASPTAYVTYLGWLLALICVVCGAALWWTRPPKEALT